MPGGHVELSNDPYYNPNLVPRRHDFLERPPASTSGRQKFVMTTDVDRSMADVSGRLAAAGRSRRLVDCRRSGLLAGMLDEPLDDRPVPGGRGVCTVIAVVVLALALAMTVRRGADRHRCAGPRRTPAALSAVAAAERKAGAVAVLAACAAVALAGGADAPRRRQRRSAWRRVGSASLRGLRRRRTNQVPPTWGSAKTAHRANCVGECRLARHGVGVPDVGLAGVVARRRARCRRRAARRRSRCGDGDGHPARRDGDDRRRVAGLIRSPAVGVDITGGSGSLPVQWPTSGDHLSASDRTAADRGGLGGSRGRRLLIIPAAFDCLDGRQSSR